MGGTGGEYSPTSVSTEDFFLSFLSIRTTAVSGWLCVAMNKQTSNVSKGNGELTRRAEYEHSGAS